LGNLHDLALVSVISWISGNIPASTRGSLLWSLRVTGKVRDAGVQYRRKFGHP
jgi:hypothetical protein